MYRGQIVFTALVLLAVSVEAPTFRDTQAAFPRVRVATARTAHTLDSLYRQVEVTADSLRLLLRVLKSERMVEVWAGGPGRAMRLMKEYPFTGFSGELGPKRARGDRQIPEGAYHIDRFNPASRFHLSLGLDYPNESDRVRTNGGNPGGDIFIHGGHVTIGCIPIGDAAVEELYVMCVDARSAGQEHLPVLIFPFDMGTPQGRDRIEAVRPDHPALAGFWEELVPLYDAFEATRRPPMIRIDGSGAYRLGSGLAEDN